jgi:uncharacterized membrane protein
MEPMQILFIATFLANIVFAFGALPWQPNPMAIHFNLTGQADGFASPMYNAILMSSLTSILTAGMLGMSVFTRKPTWINIPNRDYWLNEENRPATIRRLRREFDSLGFCTMAMFLFIQYEVFSANQMVPPALKSVQVWIGVGTFLSLMLWETVRFRLSFRLPK